MTLAAHLILAVTSGSRWPIRVLSLLLWTGCMIFVIVSHGSYILASQQARGNQRATAVTAPEKVVTRTFSTILLERAKLDSQHATLTAGGCSIECPAVTRKSQALRGRIAALDQEAVEVKQREEVERRFRSEQDRARLDPAIFALARWMGAPVEHLQLILGLLAGVLLDGIGCICWAVALPVRQEKSTSYPERSGGRASNAVAADSATDSADRSVTDCGTRQAPAAVAASGEQGCDSSSPDLLTRASAAIWSGEVHNSVRALRAYLKCSQRSALAVSRALRTGD